jgi:hypothetical protein
MTTILTSVTEIEDRIVDTIREMQKPVVEYVRKGVEQAEGRLPKLTYPKGLPKPAEVVDSQVEFAKALLATQRSFVTELVDAVAPLVDTEDGEAAPAATPPAAPKAKATKTAPKSSKA